MFNGLRPKDIVHLLSVKEAKDETPQEVLNFLDKKGYRFDESVFLKDSLFPVLRTKEYIFAESDVNTAVIQVRIFDSIGNYYTSFSQCHADFQKKTFISGWPITKNSQQDYINQNLSLIKELALMDIGYGLKMGIEAVSKNYTYTIVVYYTIWTNHFSEKVLKELSKFKKKHPNDVYLIFCNVARDKPSENGKDE